MGNQYTPIEGVKVVSNPWEEGFYVGPEVEGSSFPGWSAKEVKEWAEAARWVDEEVQAIELDAKREREYEEVLARWQEAAGSVAVGRTVDRR